MLNENGIRELCYAVRVTDVLDIEGVNNQVAVVNGWQVFIKRDEFKPGDLAIYFEIDSKVPELECFEFLRKYNFKVKTQRFVKGRVLSQGLVIKPADLGLENVAEGQFFTKELGVTYYDPEDNIRKASNEELIKTKVEKRLDRWCKKHKFLSKFKFIVNWAKKIIERNIRKTQKKKKTSNTFPSHFPYIYKSDEERVENMPWILKNKEPWIKTLKIDGTSSTYILERLRGKNKFEFYVLSRNVRQETPDQKCYHESNVYWEMAEKYQIKNFLKAQLDLHPEWQYVCLQGETAGPNVQGNPHGLKELQLFGFNFIDSAGGRWNSAKARDYVAQWGIQWVPIIDEHYILPDTMEEFKATADGPCELPGSTGLREGYVYRSLDGKQSFKNVSNQFLMSKK